MVPWEVVGGGQAKGLIGMPEANRVESYSSLFVILMQFGSFYLTFSIRALLFQLSSQVSPSLILFLKAKSCTTSIFL